MKTAAPAFELPEDLEVVDLTAASMTAASIEPTTPVLVLNRGRKPLEMTFDGNHRVLPVGLFKTEYGAARHFQERAVVPGTRNVEVGGHVSWFAILGTADQRIAVDPPEMCVPFTDEELKAFGESLEAIDRSAMTGADRFVTPVRTQTARAMSRSQGAGGRVQIDADTQVSPAAAEAAAHVFEPTTEPLATRVSEAEAAAVAHRSRMTVRPRSRGRCGSRGVDSR
jgi:hypothetical protein